MNLYLVSLLSLFLCLNEGDQAVGWKVIHNGSLKMQATKEDGKNAIILSKKRSGEDWVFMDQLL